MQESIDPNDEAGSMFSRLQLRREVNRIKRNKIYSIVIPIAIAGFCMFLITGSLFDLDYEIYGFPIYNYLSIIFAISLIISALSAALYYLQFGGYYNVEDEIKWGLVQKSRYNFVSQRSIKIDSLEEVKSELDALRQQIIDNKNVMIPLSEDEHSKLVEELRNRLAVEASDSVLESIRRDVSEIIAREYKGNEVNSFFQDSRSRLMKELDALGRRGNLNLVLGSITSVIGIILLGVIVLYNVNNTEDTLSSLSHFIPRLTLVVLIELFAYFFLSLYRTSLNEIKYFQNELTNIEAKQVALRAAFHSNSKDAMTSILNGLSTTERNHVLTKDQTTVELEKAKIESSGRNDFAKYVTEFLQKKH